MGGHFTHSRREFLQGAAAVTITASVGGVATYAVLRDGDPGPSNRSLTADELEYELFVAGDELMIGRSRGVVSAVSERATYSTADGVSGTSFSIIIESPDALDQGIHDFRHRGLGTFPMFIVPVDLPTGDSNTYEAVFNRLH